MKLRQIFENRGNSVGVCFGRWNPPHKGHKAAWEIAASFGTFYVGTNKNTEGPNDPLPYEVKLKAMETIWPEIAGHVIPEQSLFTLVSRIFSKHGEHTHLKVATDEEWLAKSLMQYNGKEGAHGYYKFASIEQVPTPRLSSATALRAAVRAGDRDGFSDAAGVDADTPIQIGKKTVAFFDLVAHYLAKHPEKVKKVKKVAEHKKGVRAMKYTKKPVNPSAQHAKAKEKLAPIKPGIEKQTDECAGVGIITKQNSTGDVNKGTPYKNLKAFNLVKEDDKFLIDLEDALLQEAGMQKIDKAAKGAMKNASTLPALNMSTGSAYMNYRMGIALAGAPDFPTKMAADNWIGGDPLLSTYTEEEFDMIKAAAKQVGAGTIQNWSGKRSQEVADVNKTSTVAKIKRNKYGV